MLHGRDDYIALAVCVVLLVGTGLYIGRQIKKAVAVSKAESAETERIAQMYMDAGDLMAELRQKMRPDPSKLHLLHEIEDAYKDWKNIFTADEDRIPFERHLRIPFEVYLQQLHGIYTELL